MDIVRTILAVGLVFILIQQAGRSGSRVWRRRALLVGAAAFALLALINILGLMRVNLPTFALGIIILASILVLASVLFLLQAWRTGEMRSRTKTVQQALADERKRRDR